MSGEWPIGGKQADGDAAAPEELLLPLALHEHVELILASGAVRAFAEKRAQQLLEHGHHAGDDAARTIDYLVRQAQGRLSAFVERAGKERNMNAPPQQRDILVRTIEIAGALLLAAWDRIHMDVPEPGE